jgi:hypothetical protein
MDPYLSYASVNGFEVVDWAAVIASGLAGTLSDEDHEKHDNLASEWNTCAVGQTSHLIHRGGLYHSPQEPNWRYLGTLGGRFCDSFGDKDYFAAETILADIKAMEKEIVESKLKDL